MVPPDPHPCSLTLNTQSQTLFVRGEGRPGDITSFHMLTLDFSSKLLGVLIGCYLLCHALSEFINHLLGFPVNFSVG